MKRVWMPGGYLPAGMDGVELCEKAKVAGRHASSRGAPRGSGPSVSRSVDSDCDRGQNARESPSNDAPDDAPLTPMAAPRHPEAMFEPRDPRFVPGPANARTETIVASHTRCGHRSGSEVSRRRMLHPATCTRRSGDDHRALPIDRGHQQAPSYLPGTKTANIVRGRTVSPPLRPTALRLVRYLRASATPRCASRTG